MPHTTVRLGVSSAVTIPVRFIQTAPVSPRPLELWLFARLVLLLLPAEPINPSLFPLCHTVLSPQRTQRLTASLCPKLVFPEIPLLSLRPSPPTNGAKIPYTTTHSRTSVPRFLQQHHHGRHTRRGWWLISLPSLTGGFPFITSKVTRSLSSPPSLPHPKGLTRTKLGWIPFQSVFMTESKGRVNGVSVGAGPCEAQAGLHAQ